MSLLVNITNGVSVSSAVTIECSKEVSGNGTAFATAGEYYCQLNIYYFVSPHVRVNLVIWVFFSPT